MFLLFLNQADLSPSYTNEKVPASHDVRRKNEWVKTYLYSLKKTSEKISCFGAERILINKNMGSP